MIDAVPRVLSAAEWRQLGPGVEQRARALSEFVADVYGDREIAEAECVPERVLDQLEHYEPDMRGVESPGGWLGLAGLDLVRGDDGRFRVLEDNTRTPVGFAYLAAARELRERHFEIPGPAPVEVRDGALDVVAEALRAAAPDERGDPSIVVLVDGPQNDAWYEQRAIARRSSVPLVTLDDLEHGRGRLCVRQGDERRAVDVVYRRTDEHRLRDERGRPTRLADALLEPCRRGAVAVVNACGSGVADDKLVLAYVEEMVRFYLGEEPLLASVATLDPGDPAILDEVLERLDELVLKPRGRAGGAGIVIGSEAGPDEIDVARRRLRERPQEFVAQERVRLSRHPTVIDGELRPRHVDLRALVAMSGDRPTAVPGGLTRMALAAGDLMVNMTQGGGVKDTWVLNSSP